MTKLLRKNPTSGVPQETDVGTVPAGGTTGQVLVKTNATNFETEWVDASVSAFDPDTILLGPSPFLHTLDEEQLGILYDGNGNVLVA